MSIATLIRGTAPRSTRVPVRAAVLALLAVGFLVAGAGAANRATGLIDGTSYESPSYGYVVEWDRPWEADEELTTSDGGVDFLFLNSFGGFINIAGVPTGFTPEEMIETAIGNFAGNLMDEPSIVATGAEDGVAYALVEDEADDARFTIHLEAREYAAATAFSPAVVTLSVMVASPETFANNAASAAAIALDGAPLFVALDAAVEEGAEEHDRGLDFVHDRKRDAGRDGRDDGDEPDRRNRAGNGLVDDFAYASPTYGYAISWDRPWEADPEFTFSDDGVDGLFLNSYGSFLLVYGSTIDAAPEAIAADWAENYSADVLDDHEIVELGEEGGTAYALVEGVSDGRSMVVHIEVRVIRDATNGEPPVIIISVFHSTAATFANNAAFAAGIELDGAPLLVTLDGNDD